MNVKTEWFYFYSVDICLPYMRYELCVCHDCLLKCVLYVCCWFLVWSLLVTVVALCGVFAPPFLKILFVVRFCPKHRMCRLVDFWEKIIN
jgi:hypothetical protein